MQAGLSLEAIAELSIALAGFAGLIAMVRSGPVHEWHPRVRIAFWMTLVWSIAAIFFSALPSILAPFGVTGWSVPSSIIGVYLVVAPAIGLWRHFRLSRQGYPTQNPWHWVICTSIPMPPAFLNLGANTAFVDSANFEAYRLGVLACLFYALLPFLASFRADENETASQ
jgi:hypothetical protein